MPVCFAEKLMKHAWNVTVLLLLFFLMSQFLGLMIVRAYIDVPASAETGEVVFRELPIGERPPLDERTSFVPILIALFIGTIILLLIIRFDWMWVWKIWFLLAVVISLTVALAAFLPPWLAGIIAFGAGCWKIFRPQFWVQNLTELFIYGGLAAIFVPLFNLMSISILLVLIAGYDAYAVWKSKHMITLAKSQTKAKVFAGLLIPYSLNLGKMNEKIKGNMKKIHLPTIKTKIAVLGGGDMGFPLLVAGVVLKEWGLWEAMIIPFFALAGLSFLLWKGEQKKFYPAMPFIGAGCFLGLGVVWVMRLFI